jgi:hypothetical protein
VVVQLAISTQFVTIYMFSIECCICTCACMCMYALERSEHGTDRVRVGFAGMTQFF